MRAEEDTGTDLGVAREPTTMPYATRNGASLYYEFDRGDTGSDDDGVRASGNGDGPATDGRETVVFVEGLGVGRWLWDWQREAVGERYDVLVPDNRGSGKSDAALPPLLPRLPRPLRLLVFLKLAGYSIEGLTADLEAVLADAGVDGVHLVGASMGGMVAQQYALDYDRARSLTLMCTTHGGDEAEPIPEETQEQIYAVPEDASEREQIRHRMEPAINDKWAQRNPGMVEGIVDMRIEQDAGEVARESQGSAGANFDVSDRVHGIDLPTLVLHGTNDRVVPVANGRMLAEKIPDSRLELIEGGSHLLMIEDADQVNDLLLAFLDGQ